MSTLADQLKGIKEMFPKKQKEESKPRQPRRIYVRPTSDARKARRLAKKTRQRKVVRCKVCFSVIDIDEAVEIDGGGTQGHLSFMMCRKHQ